MTSFVTFLTWNMSIDKQREEGSDDKAKAKQ